MDRSEEQITVSAPSDPRIGQVLGGRYRLQAVVGQGAVGVVYRATDTSTGNTVAVKLLGEKFGVATQARNRFEREGKALTRLRHAGIVELIDYGLFEGKPFLVMELLHGETLRERLQREGSLPPMEAIALVRQMLSALSVAHARGLIHRDLKPANVFIEEGQVKLLDFGLVKFVGSADTAGFDQTLTQTGMVVGTPLYMAPEQGTGDRTDARADVYAVGCVLFEALTGRAPFRRPTTTETIRAHLVSPIPVLPELSVSPGIYAGLCVVMTRALAKDPADRFPNAQGMLDALASLERTGRRRRLTAPLVKRLRKPTPWLAVVVLAVLAVWLWPNSEAVAPPAASVSDATPADAPAELSVPEALSAIHDRLQAGGELDPTQMQALLAYIEAHPDDPQSLLLLGHAFAIKLWRKDALDRYERAFALSPEVRDDPRMLENLLDMAASESHEGRARALITRAYGMAALPRARRALSEAADGGPREKRLTKLVEELLALPGPEAQDPPDKQP